MIILLDDITGANNLLPFGQLKSIAHIRIGMFTILEKWQSSGQEVYLKSENNIAPGEKFIEYRATEIPSFKFLKSLSSGHSPEPDFQSLSNAADIFKFNEWALQQDFSFVTKNKKSAPIPKEVFTKNPENIFIEEGAKISFCYLNTENGPIYISKSATIMEGAMLRGPVYCGANSVIKMGAKIYGATTIGPSCVVGGEIKNSVLMGFSNKAHDGYLGDSVVGEWCNLGAGTSNSNLKNNASVVSIQISKKSLPFIVGMKCGLLMGDYSRSAINTSFNTGSVIGVCCNIFGNQMPGKLTDNFSWGNEKYILDKAIADIDNWKKLKGLQITEEEINSIKKIYNQS